MTHLSKKELRERLRSDMELCPAVADCPLDEGRLNRLEATISGVVNKVLDEIISERDVFPTVAKTYDTPLLGTTVYASYKKMDVVAETNDGTWVQSFTDNDNRCYVLERHASGWIGKASDVNTVAISCVRMK